MADIFDRYHECKQIVEDMPECEDRAYAESILRQLLHIEQARKVAHDNYNRYRNDMNAWENGLVREIKRAAKEV
jgi:hypothetical protein